VGVLHRGKPYWGAVYAPALGDLAYGSQDRAFWIKRTFSKDEEKIELKPREFDRLSAIFDMDYHVFPNRNIDFSRDMPLNFYSAVVHFIYMATGRGRCYYFGSKIWDMAGAWAIMKLLGIEFMDYRTGEVLQEFSAGKFEPKLKLKNCHIVCKPKDFEYFKNISEEIAPVAQIA
jgi:fructose-1,6-bisphosphatase/inositol monophosphatase family enzyme